MDWNPYPSEYKKDDDKLITFIIPTIGRIHIYQTIQSLRKLKINRWEAIILFDGVKNHHIQQNLRKLNDSRLLIFDVPKIGNIEKHHAGLVRNLAFPFVHTPWVAFVDDDDTISPYYINHLLHEIQIHPDIDTVIFRMMYPNHSYLPTEDDFDILPSRVGISFCVKSSILSDESNHFMNHSFEDYHFLFNLKMKHYKLIISPYIAYYVRSNYHPFQPPIQQRVLIHIHPKNQLHTIQNKIETQIENKIEIENEIQNEIETQTQIQN